jgi:exodeoxyribonuclease V alpha subunit
VPEFVSGRVCRIVYNNDSFYVLNFLAADGVAQGLMSARGNVYGLVQLKQDVPIKLVGKWTKHPKYGPQFSFQSWEPWAETVEDVTLFLHTCVEGFSDRSLAEAMVRGLGLRTFQTLTETPAEVFALPPPGTTAEALEGAVLGWERALAVRDLSTLLKAGGLTGQEIQAAMGHFGMEAAKVVRENPFRLMEIPGFDFPKVDRLASQLGGLPSDPRRIEGVVLWALQDSAKQNGHLCLPRGEIPAAVIDLMRDYSLAALPTDNDTEGAYAKAVDNLVERGALKLDSSVGVYLPDLYRYERESAAMLTKLLLPSTISIDPKPFLEDYERTSHITFSDAQRQVVEQITQHRVFVLTGLPGTGKTTAVRALVRLFDEARIKFALMAPTGIAAKRLAAVTGHHAATIHRALRYDGSVWGHGPSNRFIVEAVIVDEMSMVDQELLYRLLSALQPETILVLVGDDAQLPSVGPGNVLRELVDCPDIPNVRLTQIFRQTERSGIVLQSHTINRGDMLTLGNPKDDNEFKFVRMSDEETIVRFIVETAAKLKSRNANFQVLSAKYDGTVGVNNLNERLRDRLNPELSGMKVWKRGDLCFRLGDRLMVVKNDYKLHVYNGDMGKLTRIGYDSLTVRIHGVGEQSYDMEIEIPFDMAEEKLRLAYAITVHKCQGSEFDTILMPIVKTQGRMLQRNLLYTAVTRARRRVWLVGEEAAVQRSIMNNKVIHRNTAFSKVISQIVAAGVETGSPPVTPSTKGEEHNDA